MRSLNLWFPGLTGNSLTTSVSSHSSILLFSIYFHVTNLKILKTMTVGSPVESMLSFRIENTFKYLKS